MHCSFALHCLLQLERCMDLQVWSRKPDLHEIALKLFSLAVQYRICLEPKWVPRKLNEKADFLSRTLAYDDWYHNSSVFPWLDAV